MIELDLGVRWDNEIACGLCGGIYSHYRSMIKDGKMELLLAVCMIHNQ